MSLRHQSRLGFTLLELVAAVAIILVLAGVVVPAIAGKIDKAKQARARADLKQITDAFTSYRADTGVWPSNSTFSSTTTTSTDLLVYRCLYANTFSLNNWSGPYLNDGYANGTQMQVAVTNSTTQAGILDPWGHAYVVYYFATGYNSGQGSIVLVCKGPNNTVNSTLTQIWGGQAASDDLVQVVTRKY